MGTLFRLEISASPAIAGVMPTLMFQTGVTIEPDSVYNVLGTLEDGTVMNVFQGSMVILYLDSAKVSQKNYHLLFIMLKNPKIKRANASKIETYIN